MFRRRERSRPQLRIRPEFQIFLDDPRVPRPDAVLESMLEEVQEEPTLSAEETLKKLQQDPDIQIVLEAAKTLLKES